MELKDSIKAGRLSKNISQQMLAEQLDISVTHLQHIESGNRNPSVPLLIDLAKILNLSLDAWLCPFRNPDSTIEQAGSLICQLNPRDLNIVIATMKAMLREK